MKKIVLLLLVLFSLNTYSQNFTFELDLSLYNGASTSVEFFRAGTSYPMTNTGGNIYSYTTFVPPFQLSNYTYKFKVDGVFESFSTLLSCLTIVNNDTLRAINLNTTTPSVVCWESCSACATAIPGCTDYTANNYSSNANLDDGSCLYNVTFFVDMTNVTDAYTIPEVNGDFNSWCGNCASMTDANNDSIWEIIIPMTTGTYIYKFSADDWNIEESLYEFDNCVIGNSPYINRTLDVIGNQVLDTVCWNTCYSCDTERNFYNITFQVDMSNVTSLYTAPEVNGTFNNWCGNCWVLDPQGNNIYSRSFNIDTSLHTFKFSADNWNIEENLDSALSCVDLGFDSLGSLQYVNRSLRATSDTIINVCWESCIACIYGCIDPIACNFNSLAEVDDGSCDLPNGCNNPLYLEYSASVTCPDANDCLTLIVNGCTDPLACNYNNLANLDNGSCDLPSGCGDPLYLEFSASVTCSNANDCLTLIVNGCTDPLACNYNNLANLDNGSCDLPNGCGDALYLEYDASVTCSDANACLTLIINGCTDTLACNYNSLANIDDSSCFTIYGCMSIIAVNYDSLANCSDTCIYAQVTYGCTDSIAINYNPTASIDDTSCIYCYYGCINVLACNYDSLATCDDGSCNSVYGCTDTLACNYNPLATCDDGTCLTIYGCLDTLACNYNPLATCDDGTCLTIYGCTDTLACNYNPLATCDDGTCLTIYGCLDTLACNYNPLATCDDGTCLTIYGCTDTLAFNYDTLATCFDSICIYEYNVTFQLDLRNQNTLTYVNPELNGSFNSWCGNCAQMTDVNNDSIWEITIPILEGVGPVSGLPGWEYKFSADNWNIQESLFSGDPCVFSAFGFSNRFINVTKDTILDPVCWQSCNDCYAPQTAYNVTFRLDMNNNSNFSVPEVNGEFNSWCGNCWPMTDDDGDNIWEFNTLIDTAKHEYKFSADNWGIQEQLDSSATCVFTTVDSLGNVFSNRYLHINSDTILDVVCWNECDTCLTTTSLILNENDNSYTIFPNPSTGIFYIKSSDKIDKVIVYDILNKKILEKNNPGLLQPFNISDINSNILFLEIYINDKVIMDKLIITK